MRILSVHDCTHKIHARSRFDTYGLKRLVLAYTISDFLLPGDLAIVFSIGAILGLGLIYHET